MHFHLPVPLLLASAVQQPVPETAVSTRLARFLPVSIISRACHSFNAFKRTRLKRVREGEGEGEREWGKAFTRYFRVG